MRDALELCLVIIATVHQQKKNNAFFFSVSLLFCIFFHTVNLYFVVFQNAMVGYIITAIVYDTRVHRSVDEHLRVD